MLAGTIYCHSKSLKFPTANKEEGKSRLRKLFSQPQLSCRSSENIFETGSKKLISKEFESEEYNFATPGPQESEPNVEESRVKPKNHLQKKIDEGEQRKQVSLQFAARDFGILFGCCIVAGASFKILQHKIHVLFFAVFFPSLWLAVRLLSLLLIWFRFKSRRSIEMLHFGMVCISTLFFVLTLNFVGSLSWSFLAPPFTLLGLYVINFMLELAASKFYACLIVDMIVISVTVTLQLVLSPTKLGYPVVLEILLLGSKLFEFHFKVYKVKQGFQLIGTRYDRLLWISDVLCVMRGKSKLASTALRGPLRLF